MKIAIAYWQNRISPVFDVSDNLCTIDIEDNREIKRENIILTNRSPFARAREISDIGVDTLICGAVSHILEAVLTNTGIHVIGFICGELDSIVSAFIGGKLSNGAFFMPGCYGGVQQRQRFRMRNGKH